MLCLRHPPNSLLSLSACLSICSYEQLLVASEQLADQLRASSSLPASSSRDGPRIGVYAEPSPGYVAGTWAAWMAGGIAVPLSPSHPPQELQYVMQDAGVSTVSSGQFKGDQWQGGGLT